MCIRDRTDPQLKWSYDKEGIVKIVRKEQGYWKKGNPEWDNAPDKGSFLTSDKYYVQSLKEGTVIAVSYTHLR